MYSLEFYIRLVITLYVWLGEQKAMVMTPEEDLKKPLKVHFEGEEGVDGGGLQKEYFQVGYVCRPKCSRRSSKAFSRRGIVVRFPLSTYHTRRLVEVAWKSLSILFGYLCVAVEMTLITGYLKNLLVTWLTHSLAGVILGRYRRFMIRKPPFVYGYRYLHIN